MILRTVVIAIVALALLWIPGAVIARLLRCSFRDPAEQFGHEFAFGLSVWPVLLLLTTLLRWTWTPFFARTALAVLLAALVVLWRRSSSAVRLPSAALLVVLALVILTRISHVRDVVYPLWVDSVHHTMIVRLIAEQGVLPASYAPFIPESTFYYHWGFHAGAAFVAWVSGSTDFPRLLLIYGQVLNVLTFFAVYAGAVALTRSRRTALLSATLATLVSLFPAYYVSWGRYTQLAGLLILPPLAVSYWRLGRRPSKARVAAVAILAAGLLLVHVRVALVFAILAAILTVLLAIQRRWRGLAWCAVAAAIALLLTAPWLVRLMGVDQVGTILRPGASVRWETSNAVPDDLLWAPHNLPLFILGTGGLFSLLPIKAIPLVPRIAGIALWLALVAVLQFGARRRHSPLLWRLGVLFAWIAATALLINLPGIPRIVPNSAAIVMVYLPVSIAGAAVATWALRNGKAITVATLLIAAGGAWAMRTIINPVTLLVTRGDVAALGWIRDHTPKASKFAVGVQPWIGDSFIGIDGGYWIPLASDRSSILPPGLYAWVLPPAAADETTATLRRWRDTQISGDLRALEELARDGVTHVYFGAKNDTPIRGAIRTTAARRVYERDGVEIYALR